MIDGSASLRPTEAGKGQLGRPPGPGMGWPCSRRSMRTRVASCSRRSGLAAGFDEHLDVLGESRVTMMEHGEATNESMLDPRLAEQLAKCPQGGGDVLRLDPHRAPQLRQSSERSRGIHDVNLRARSRSSQNALALAAEP